VYQASRCCDFQDELPNDSSRNYLFHNDADMLDMSHTRKSQFTILQFKGVCEIEDFE